MKKINTTLLKYNIDHNNEGEFIKKVLQLIINTNLQHLSTLRELLHDYQHTDSKNLLSYIVEEMLDGELKSAQTNYDELFNK